MVDHSVPFQCPCQKSLLSDGALASWAVVGTLWSQDLGLWNQKQTETPLLRLCLMDAEAAE